MTQDIQPPQRDTKLKKTAVRVFFSILLYGCVLWLASSQLSLATETRSGSLQAFLSPTQFQQDKKITRPPFAIAKTKKVPYSADESAESDDTPSFVEGKNYRRVPFGVLKHPTIQQFLLKDPGKIQVISFFNYGCFWCGRLNRPMMEWEAQIPNSVAYYRYPLVFNKTWETLARVFYTLKKLGKGEELDNEIFEAIHQNHINLADNTELLAFMENHGIPPDKFMQIYHSAAISREVKKGNDLSLAYRIAESPVVIINTPSGSFMCSVPEVGSETRFTQLLNYLIQAPPESEKTVNDTGDHIS